jgi:D-glycero-alpha-D-manno-heptose-7-phosphate kinase
MIISRTPFRVSLFGGGTDLRSFYSRENGEVLSTSIQKYIYVIVKKQHGIIESKFRVNWKKVEFADSIDEIQHPIVRECLRFMKFDFPIEITTFADIPSSSGLGSSSAFTVGLLNCLYAFQGSMITKSNLAKQAARVEVDILGRVMGKQDHYASSYGGLNKFTFKSNEDVFVEPIFASPRNIKQLNNNLLMFYTGQQRNASVILEAQNELTDKKFDDLLAIRNFVNPAIEIISKGRLSDIGYLLNESWKLKKNLSNRVSNNAIDEIYNTAINAGALGGKILGAGGGGFLLVYADRSKQKNIIKAFSKLPLLNFKMDNSGSRITYYDAQ